MKPNNSCTLLGILDDGWAGLSDTARQRLAAADLVIGAGRTLDLVRPYLAANAQLRDMDGPDLMQGLLLDSSKANMGILFSVALPKALDAVQKARTA